MSPGATLLRLGPDALAFVSRGSARPQPHNDGRGYLSNLLKLCSSLGPAEVILAELPPNLRGLRASPFLSRSHIDDFCHSLQPPSTHTVHSFLRRGWNNDTGMGHAESYSSRAESQFDRGDGQNDRG